MSAKRRHPAAPVGPWEVLNTKVVYSAPPWVRLAMDQVRLPDGRVVDGYHQVTLPEFVIVVAHTPDGRVLIERLYKHGVGEVTLTLPAGMREEGEDPLVCARRELLEETGYASDDWLALGQFVENGTYGCGTAHMFLARNAQRITDPKTGDLEAMEILLMTRCEVAEAVRTGRIVVLSTVAAFAIATNPLLIPA